jgi:hypothetical protein
VAALAPTTNTRPATDAGPNSSFALSNTPIRQTAPSCAIAPTLSANDRMTPRTTCLRINGIFSARFVSPDG